MATMTELIISTKHWRQDPPSTWNGVEVSVGTTVVRELFWHAPMSDPPEENYSIPISIYMHWGPRTGDVLQLRGKWGL